MLLIETINGCFGVTSKAARKLLSGWGRSLDMERNYALVVNVAATRRMLQKERTLEIMALVLIRFP